MHAKCSEEKAYKHSALVELIAAKNNANFLVQKYKLGGHLWQPQLLHNNIIRPHKVFLFSLSAEEVWGHLP